MEEKVACINCKYYHDYNCCGHPKHLIQHINPVKGIYFEYGDCCKYNRNNNCQEFELKLLFWEKAWTYLKELFTSN